MFGKILIRKKIFNILYASIRSHQVTVLGGATDVGQTISLMLRSQPNITKLVIHDTLKETPGVTLDLSHVPTNAEVKGYVGEEYLEPALMNSELIICAAGVTRTPSITENSCFTTNTVFIKSLAKAIARLEPMPFIGIVTEPINSLIPMTAEIVRNYGELDVRKLFGISTIDFLRAQILYASIHKLHPSDVSVPVIGGRSYKTCIPLLSQALPAKDMNEREAQTFTMKLRKADHDIMKAKNGLAPVLSVAHSAVLFTRSVLNALDGNDEVVHAFVDNNDFGTDYFSGLVHINRDGVKEMQRYSKLSNFECQLLENSIEELRKDVLQGKKILEYA
ncbi:unnamed protein product [Arctia plantaginis]|uniref:Malate dehydrogenase, mitochondrial n=1 Tax=Arctia plantaginis TaxID=874455 RepID=A0A8S0ZUT7_ARCPL|nr:unnamed protein product [Arctia plantaginis]